MVVKRRYSLFEVFGVELEYMVVDRTTLAVRPLVDRLFFDMTGNWTADVDNGDIAWSNELVNHVVEFKTNGPAPALEGLAERFHANVLQLNDRLAPYGAQLLPSGAHPLMDPFTETVLWPHEYSDVYRLYNRIFDCRGHGWANLQSTHLNLPFRNDDEFGPLHAATRVLLPILPALSASTPLLDGALTGYADSRLETYRHNQERIPSIAGQVIPEAVFTRAAYYERIFQPIRNDIRPFDTDNLLDQHFLNSRGAIARFDRGALEIRVLDLQEAPLADLAILAVVVTVLKTLIAGRWTGLGALKAWHENDLAVIFLTVIRDGERARITNPAYLRLFGIDADAVDAAGLWRHLSAEVGEALPAFARAPLRHLLTHGTLSTRIVRHLDGDLSPVNIRRVYRLLADCLATNTLLP